MQTAVPKVNVSAPLAPPRLLSRSTILILSGVLIGMGLSNGVTADTQLYGFSAGIIGLIAYLGLDSHNRHQKQKAAQQAIERATCVVEDRLGRHIPTHPVAKMPPAPPPRTDRKFAPGAWLS